MKKSKRLSKCEAEENWETNLKQLKKKQENSRQRVAQGTQTEL